MRTILITGGIASGKSEVRRYLESKGYPVYDCDSRTKALYDSVPGLKARVEEAIGLPFSQVGVIFSDARKREALEAVVYPEVLKDFNAWRAACGDLAFMESAIALEKRQFDGTYNEVWLVKAPLSERKKRNSKVAERLSSQKEVPDSRADIIIENDSDIQSLHRKIDKILNKMEKTDLSKILSVSGKHGLYKFLALARGNAVVAEHLCDGTRTSLDAHSRITTLADIAIYTSEGEMKLKDVFLALNKALGGKEAPASKGNDAEIKALFEKAVPNYDADRFYVSHMRKIVDWYSEIVKFASLDFVEEEGEVSE